VKITAKMTDSRIDVSSAPEDFLALACKFIRLSIFSRHLFFSVPAVILAFSPLTLLADTNTNADEIPPLRPPRGEISAGYWEQHSSVIILSSVLVLALIGLTIWWVRHGRPKAIIPPAVQARQALQTLASQSENGVVLSRVSQIIRRYFINAFDLPQGELTTTEFCSLVSRKAEVGEQLSHQLDEFLHRCDERKFSPSPAGDQPLKAVPAALKFVDDAETRLAELRAAREKMEPTKS
jgi:hypothetical protein